MYNTPDHSTYGIPARRVAASAGVPVSQQTILRWIHAGKLPATRIGYRLFVRPDDLRRVALGAPPEAAQAPGAERA